MSTIQTLTGDLPKVFINKVLLESNANGAKTTWDDPHFVDPIETSLSDTFVPPSENLVIQMDLAVKDQKQKSGLGSWLDKKNLLHKYLRFTAVVLHDTNSIGAARMVTFFPNLVALKDIFIKTYVSSPNAWTGTHLEPNRARTISLFDFNPVDTPDNEFVMQGVSGGNNEVQSEKDLINSNTLSEFIFSLKDELAKNPDNLAIVAYSFIDIEALINDYPDLHIGSLLDEGQDRLRAMFASDFTFEPIITEGELNTKRYRYFLDTGEEWFGEASLVTPTNESPQTTLQRFANDGNPANFSWRTADPNALPLSVRSQNRNIIHDFRITKKLEELMSFDTNIYKNPASSYPSDDRFSVYNPAIELNYPSLKAPVISDMYPSRDVEGNCGFMFSFDQKQFTIDNTEFPHVTAAPSFTNIVGVKIIREKVKRKEYNEKDFSKKASLADDPPFWDEPSSEDISKASEINSNNLNFELEEDYNESIVAFLSNNNEFRKIILDEKVTTESPDQFKLLSGLKSKDGTVSFKEMVLQVNELSEHENIRCFSVVDKEVSSKTGLYRYTVELELFDRTRQPLESVMPALKNEAKNLKRLMSLIENNPKAYDYKQRKFSNSLSWQGIILNVMENFVKPLNIFLEATGGQAVPLFINTLKSMISKDKGSISGLLTYQKLVNELLGKYEKVLATNKNRKIEVDPAEHSESAVDTAKSDKRINKVIKAFPTLFDASGHNKTGISYLFNESSDTMDSTLLTLDSNEAKAAMALEYGKYYKNEFGVFEAAGKNVSIDSSRYSHLSARTVYIDGLPEGMVELDSPFTIDDTYSKLFLALMLYEEQSQKFYDKTHTKGVKTSELIDKEKKLESVMASRNLTVNGSPVSWPTNSTDTEELDSFNDGQQTVEESAPQPEVSGLSDLMGTSDILFSLVSADKLKTVDASLVDKFNLELQDNFYDRYVKSQEAGDEQKWLMDLPVQIKYISRLFQEAKGEFKINNQYAEENFAPYIVEKDVVNNLKNLGHFFFNFQTLVKIEYLDSYGSTLGSDNPNINMPVWKTLNQKILKDSASEGLPLLCRLSVYNNPFVIDQTIADLRLMTYNKHFIINGFEA